MGSPDSLAVPDAESTPCRQVAAGAHPAVLYLTRPKGTREGQFKTQITIDEIRRVNRFLAMTSHDRGNRIVIVDPVDDLNRNAANALLKSLEEPPSKTYFLLVSHAPGRILKTIISRCLILRLHPLDQNSLTEVLERLPLQLPGKDDGLDTVLRRANGSPRNAILLTQFGGAEIADAADQVIDAGKFDVRKAHEVASAISGRTQGIQFDIFNQHLLDRIATAACEESDAGNLADADRLGALWQEATQTVADTAVYNLDRKQHVIGLLHRLNGALRAG